jgi:sec-independent protein translocase protein TatA
MGTLGVQEMVTIVLVAFILFGPNKLPELGRTIGKILTEFRRVI